MSVQPNLRITVIRNGSFSGSARSLITALEETSSTKDVNVMPLARQPGLLPWRAAGMLEAARAGRGVPWSKTSAWSAGVQRQLTRQGLMDGREPILFIQSLVAAQLPPHVKYAIYTDRVGLEGAAVGGPFASKFSGKWLERERTFLRRADRVFVMGPSTRDALIDLYGVPSERVEVVGAGPNCPIGSPSVSTRCEELLFVGTQWELKGGPELLEAFRAVRQSHPDLRLTVLGVEPPGSIPVGVRVVGRVPHTEMPSFYRSADALVIPTHMEAFGIAILEALLHGVPVVGTTVGNQEWLIGDAGICVRPGDVDGLKQSIVRMIEDYRGFKARAFARRESLGEFRWEAVSQHVLRSLSA